MEPTKWTVELDEVCHNIEFWKNPHGGRHRLVIDGEEQSVVQRNFHSWTGGIDIPIWLGDTQAHFVLQKGVADLIIDGKYWSNGRDYIPPRGIPWWAWLFVAINLLFPVFTVGGALMILLAAAGTIVTITLASHRTMKLWLRLLLCFVVLACIIGISLGLRFWIQTLLL